MTFLRVMGFSVVMLLGFMGVSHILPQVEPDTSAPVAVSTDGLDMDGMIALGEALFSGKGTCTLCHNGMGRAPDTLAMDMSAIFPERLLDARYSGVSTGQEGAEAIAAYILESMQNPSAFVVEGFGKKGSNDTESPMPTVDQAPIELSMVEMNAVTAFLQDLAGLTPTISLPSADDAPVTEVSVSSGEAVPLLTSATDIVDEYGCAGCHDLGGSGADMGPTLYGIGKRMGRATVMEAIIDPNAVIADGYDADFMPDYFGEEMRGSELLILTDYLLALPDTAPVSDDDDKLLAITGLEVVDKFGCAGCHDLEGSEAEIGPVLNGIGARMSVGEIRDAILDPNAVIADGYEAEMMPDYFGEDMADSEIELITDYLMKLPE